MTVSETLKANDEAIAELFNKSFGKKFISRFKRPITFFDVNVNWEHLAAQAATRRKRDGRFNVAHREAPVPGVTNLPGVFNIEMDGRHYTIYHNPTVTTIQTRDGSFQNTIVPERISLLGKEVRVDPRTQKHTFMFMMLNPQFEGSPCYWSKERKRDFECETEFYNSSNATVVYRMNDEQQKIDAEREKAKAEMEAMARIHDMSIPFMHKLAERLRCMPSPDEDDPTGALRYNLGMKAKQNPVKFIQESKKITMTDAALTMAITEEILYVKDNKWWFKNEALVDLPDKELDEAKQRAYLIEALDDDIKAEICDYAERHHAKTGKHKSVGRPPVKKALTVE